MGILLKFPVLLLKFPVLLLKLPVLLLKLPVLLLKLPVIFFKFSLLFFKFAPQNVGGGSGELEIPPGFPLSTRLAPHFPVIFFRDGLGEGRGKGGKCRISVAFSQKSVNFFGGAAGLWKGGAKKFPAGRVRLGGVAGLQAQMEGDFLRKVVFRKGGSVELDLVDGCEGEALVL